MDIFNTSRKLKHIWWIKVLSSCFDLFLQWCGINRGEIKVGILLSFFRPSTPISIFIETGKQQLRISIRQPINTCNAHTNDKDNEDDATKQIGATSVHDWTILQFVSREGILCLQIITWKSIILIYFITYLLPTPGFILNLTTTTHFLKFSYFNNYIFILFPVYFQNIKLLNFFKNIF